MSERSGKEELLDVMSDLSRETDIHEVCEIFGTVIKRDFVTTALTFLGLLLTYTDRNQVVICYKADSSTGKSYVPLEIVALFPDQEEDVVKLAGASPQSFFHDPKVKAIYEEDVDEDGKPAKHLKHLLFDLERKILIFKDQPDFRLLARLRSFLSKDEREAAFKIVDRTTSGRNRTKTVVLRGYATLLYCSAKLTGEDQENTRTFILSPESGQEKLREAIDLIVEKETNFDVFRQSVMADPQRRWLAQRLKTIKTAHIREINLTPDDSAYLKEQFLKRNPYLVPRNTRDFPRLIALAKSHALLNYMRRRTDQQDVIEANRCDIDIALELYDHIAQSNELGIPPQLLDWYTRVLVPIWRSQSQVADRKTVLRRHVDIYHQPLNRHRLEEEFIPSLESANLVTTEQDSEDHRRVLYMPLRDLTGNVPQMCDTPPIQTQLPIITQPGDISPPQRPQNEAQPA